MIRYKVSRKGPTSNGMIVSTVLHGLLLLLLVVQAGRQAAVTGLLAELTEIAYIEAHYGEDVAAKVKMKTTPLLDTALRDPGRGISSESVLKPKVESPQPPRPESKPAVADVEVPRLEVDSPELLAQAAQLQARTPLRDGRPIVDTSSPLGGTLQAADTPGPAGVTTIHQDSFKPQGSSLQSRGSKIIITDQPLPPATAGGRQAQVTEVDHNLAGGGLRAAGDSRGTYRAPSAPLAPAAQDRSKGGQGVVDVTGPRGGTGGSETGARRTILDYGSGSGSGSGRLAGRKVNLAEAVDGRAIVDDPSESAESRSNAITEVKMDGKGVSMTISGQISGRKILQSAVPDYPERAKRNGWEGAVAVHFTVLADGRVKDNVYFEQTSAHSDLNQAALEAIKQFHFAPLPAEQASVEQWGVITIIFRLR